MRSARIDRAFECYRTTGDPRQLAVVFDATARELFRLAWHLVGERHAAEDLVQGTFLAAIEAAATFVPDREVLPWLCGILANRARDLRRHRHVRAQPVPPQRLDVVDPVMEAGARELDAVVGRAIRALDEPYRQVLLLHLEHGLGGAEIGETLVRPEATVRSQLQRGLERLRRVLPIGIAGSVRVMAPSVDLGAMREVVLAKAIGAAPVVTSVLATAVITGTMMNKVLAVSLVILALLGSSRLWLGEASVAVPTADGAVAAPADGVRRVAALSDTTDREARPVLDNAVRGRVASFQVSAEDGSPLVDVAAQYLLDDRENAPRNPTRRPLAAVVDGSDGFHIVVPPTTMRIAVTVVAKGSARTAFELLAPFEFEARTQLALPVMASVAVKVVDSITAAPLPDVRIEFNRVNGRTAGHVLQAFPVSAVWANAEAAYTLAIPTGVYQVAAVALGYETIKKTVTIRRRTESLELRMDAAPPVAFGVVMEDSTDLPIASARVELVSLAWSLNSGRPKGGSQLTDERGEFRFLYGMPTAGLPVCILSVTPPATRPDLEELRCEVPSMSGEKCVLRLCSAAHRVRIVEDRHDGRRPEYRLAWRLQSGVVGHQDWEGIPQGAMGDYVLPPSGEWHKNAWLRLTVDSASPAPREIYSRLDDLPRRKRPDGVVHEWNVGGEEAVAVSVVTRNGAALAGAVVQVLYTPWGIGTAFYSSPRATYDPSDSVPLFGNSSELVAADQTNADGVTTLAIALRPNLYLRCAKDGYRTEFLPMPAANRVDVVMTETGTAEGILEDYKRGWYLRAYPVDGDGTMLPSVLGTEIALSLDGRFHMVGFRPGTYRLYVLGDNVWGLLGTINVVSRAGEAVHFRWQQPALQDITIESDGLFVGDEICMIHVESGARSHANVLIPNQVHVDVGPGEYQVIRARGVALEKVRVWSDRLVRVGPVGAKTFALTFRESEATVRLMLGGAPLARRLVHLAGVTGSDGTKHYLRTDGDGWIRMRGFPPGGGVLVLVEQSPGSSWDGRYSWRVSSGDLGGSVEGEVQ